jgi:hypothetical protein
MTVPPHRVGARLRKQRQRQMERAGKRTYRLVLDTSVLTSSFRGQQRTRYAQAEFFASLPISVVQLFNLAVMHKSVSAAGVGVRPRFTAAHEASRIHHVTRLRGGGVIVCFLWPLPGAQQPEKVPRIQATCCQIGLGRGARTPLSAAAKSDQLWGGEGPDTFVFR